MSTVSVSFLLQKGKRTSGWAWPRGLWGARLPRPWLFGGVQCPVCPAPGALTNTSGPHKGLVFARLQPAAVGNAPRFLQYLTTELHQQVPGSLVLWYDSVVSSGQLKWQDELNEHNR